MIRACGWFSLIFLRLPLLCRELRNLLPSDRLAPGLLVLGVDLLGLGFLEPCAFCNWLRSLVSGGDCSLLPRRSALFSRALLVLSGTRFSGRFQPFSSSNRAFCFRLFYGFFIHPRRPIWFHSYCQASSIEETVRLGGPPLFTRIYFTPFLGQKVLLLPGQRN